MFKSNRNPQFRSKFSEDIFYTKYSHKEAETFHELSCTLVEDVCQEKLTRDEKEQLIDHISNLRFIPVVAIFTMQEETRSFLITVTFSRQKKTAVKIGLISLGSLSPA